MNGIISQHLIHVIGVMAQEVMKVVPEAVYAEEDGFLSVYYDMIDVNMELVR